MEKEYKCNPKTETDTCVSFSLYDKEGMIIRPYPREICFSAVSYEVIPPETDHLTYWKDKVKIPYSFEICERWTKDITECGFPCSISQTKGAIVWKFNLSDFKYKLHFVCALTLARALAEKGVCRLVELYFGLLEKNPKMNKFEALQLAHRNIEDVCEYFEYNNNHMVTYPSNGDTVTKKRIFG